MSGTAKKPSGLLAGDGEEHEQYFYPHEMIKFAMIFALVIGVLAFLGTVVPMPLGEKADALHTPPGIEPEWYFLPVYEILKFVPRWLGLDFCMIVFPVLVIVIPFFWRPITRWQWGRAVLCTVVAVPVLFMTGGLVINQIQRSQSFAAPGSGQAIFQQDCGSCHGTSGEMQTGTDGSVLAESKKRTDAAYVTKAITDGVGTMPPVKLPAEDVKKVVRYVTTQMGTE